MLALQECDADAADQIGRAVDAAEALIDFLGIAQVVDEHHHLGALGTPVVANRWPLPVYASAAGILGVEDTLPVAQTGDKGPARLLAKDVAVRAPLFLEHVLHD